LGSPAEPGRGPVTAAHFSSLVVFGTLTHH
jgi:hypothetical protein